MTPLASVAMLEKLALLKIARWSATAWSGAFSFCLRAVAARSPSAVDRRPGCPLPLAPGADVAVVPCWRPGLRMAPGLPGPRIARLGRGEPVNGVEHATPPPGPRQVAVVEFHQRLLGRPARRRLDPVGTD